MSELFNSFPGNCPESFLCYYANQSSRIQIIRITNIPSFYLERVVFPGQRLVFEAVNNAKLEVHTSDKVTTIITDIIPCEQLICNDRKTLTKVPCLTMV
ncbi:MAG: DUF1830 domain-containing protein [Symploca sp. SIO2G7]|nr:DUF1830 domain-containing protein [Symploca sp. SIO2G7]